MLLSDPASRRQPLHLTRPSPPSGWPEDLHLQTAEHAQHTTKPLARRTLRVGAGGGSRLTMAVFWVTRRSPVAHLRKLMLEELQRRNYSQTTARAYLLAVRQFRRVLPPTAGSTGPRSHPAISVLSSAGEKAQPPFRRATGVGATILLREDVEAALHAGAHPVSQSSAPASDRAEPGRGGPAHQFRQQPAAPDDADDTLVDRNILP